MNFREYITRYRLLSMRVCDLERKNKILNDENYLALLNNCKIAKMDKSGLESLIMYRDIESTVKKYRRLISRYAIRITRACEKIKSAPLREYAIFRFVYGITNEKIAENSFYSVRTVYRNSKKAQRELEKALLSVMPKRRRIVNKKYKPSHKVYIKDYSVSEEIENKVKAFKPDNRKPLRVIREKKTDESA